MKIAELDTPALLIDKKIMVENVKSIQQYANQQGIGLRPHTKTHKMPALAKMQEQLGAKGITVAKTGEAEVMAEYGLRDIFIANEVVGEAKLKRIRKLAETIQISFGIDHPDQVKQIELVFAGAEKPAQVLIEIEVGEKRSGIIEEDDFRKLLETVAASENIAFKGIFSHDGHTYKAGNTAACKQLYLDATERTLHFAGIAEEMGAKPEVVSIGSTPPVMLQFDIPKGVTEIRPGTYIFMDASQANVIGTFDRCAASVLATVISKPTRERVILDVGAKGITAQTRNEGITKTNGLGRVKGSDNVFIDGVFDEHAIIYDESFSKQINIGDKVEIIPNHICPVTNLHEKAYVVSDSEIAEVLPVACRGKLQ
ncbi:D-TA family PLP-dependent enzyme [Virgibacillus halophilus]|uniref:D-TA family PLP-dependent enzyme n=1 Tax=Tigheibacillus halophilus TaxID=361280 RepID=A0ABU5C8U2_9BACI|nr:D-TA family PLP-dependent enzyme [Virgibacillus halophilus]